MAASQSSAGNPIYQVVLASYIHPVPQLKVLLQHGSAAERFLTIIAQPADTNRQKEVTHRVKVRGD